MTIPRLTALLTHLGSAVELVQWTVEDRFLDAPVPAPEVIGRVTDEALGKAMRDVEGWLERGLDVRTVLDAQYPRSLHNIFDRPPLVFVRGQWREEEDSRSIAVVGTRKPSPQGVKRARKLAQELCHAGFTIVSGLALGIDTAAHEAALAAEGRTVAVMGTGLDHVYPAKNRDLADRILSSGGALLTQFLPHQRPDRWTFPLRNVVMSGLSMATVVVEAGSTSGARLQARVALRHGRAVFLLRSLVREHEWAAEYVEEGAYGTRAIEVRSVGDILSRLVPSEAPAPAESLGWDDESLPEDLPLALQVS